MYEFLNYLYSFQTRESSNPNAQAEVPLKFIFSAYEILAAILW